MASGMAGGFAKLKQHPCVDIVSKVLGAWEHKVALFSWS